MMEVHTLGDTLIKVGEKEIRPTSPLVFAALLYLGVERGRRVPRAALQELLFPNASERSGAHSLRQLLYKLRQLGAPIEADAAGVTAPFASVEVDVLALENGGGVVMDRLLDAPAVLPSYQPAISESFASWLDAFMQRAQSRVVARLTTILAQSRDSGDGAAVERAAGALLKIDPFNEDATIARAEVLALKGQKQAAVRLLESFASEVGQTSGTLRLPADVLRRRIEDRLDAVERNRVPLIGRDKELALMLAQFTRSLEGQPTVSVIWGDAGIGKTRLVEELSAHLLLKRASVETVLCQPHDAGRPLGALIDVVPKLLNARGALGVAPDSLETLKRLSGDASPVVEAAAVADPDYGTARIRMAISDLLVSIAGERSLILLVEDAHWLDPDSVRLLTRSLPTQRARLHIVLTFRGRPLLLEERRLSDRVFVRQLDPLDSHASQSLLGQTLGNEVAIEADTRSDCVSLAAGNPLFLCTIAEHLRLRGGVLPVRAELSELLKQRLRILPAQSLLLMRVLTVLGAYGTPERLIEATGLPYDATILALQDVADRGLVSSREGLLRCSHDLLADVVLVDTPEALRRVVSQRVAFILERDGNDDRHIGMLRTSADQWQGSGDTERALGVLRRCAALAVELSQPSFACRILSDAQNLATENTFIGLVQETIEAAYQTRDRAVLLQNIDRFVSALQARGETMPSNHRYALLRLSAAQFSGESVHSELDLLFHFAIDPSRPVDERILAVRTALIDAVRQLDARAAVRFWPVIDQVALMETERLEAKELQLLFHTYFGDLNHAHRYALEMLEGANKLSPNQIANVARALQYAGDVQQAVPVSELAFAEADRLGLHALSVRLCGTLASMHSILGDFKSVDRWVGFAKKQCEKAGIESDALTTYYQLLLALHSHDLRAAREALSIVRQRNEAAAPHATRTLVGIDLLLSHLEKTLDAATLDFSQLESLDDAGRDHVEHGVFALGLYVANVAAGRPDVGARRLRDYEIHHKRERYSYFPFYKCLGLGDTIISDLQFHSEVAQRLYDERG